MKHPYLSRRNFIKCTALTTPFVSSLCLSACGHGTADKLADSGGNNQVDASPDLSTKDLNSHDDMASSDAKTDPNNSDTVQDAEGDQSLPNDWAVGGTDLISEPFPNDSIFNTGAVCAVALTQATTKGPCYFQDDTGEDISLGLTGLPMQLSLRVEDSDCKPLSGYTVEIWHCDVAGVYSADTSMSQDSNGFATQFCSGGQEEALESSWYRGQLQTNSSGRVNFKTCFPGWYPGRTIHIHFAVSKPGSDKRIISQFCFTDELAEDICLGHELYSPRGVQDRTLAGGRDGVFPTSGIEPFLLHTKKNSDGTLLAFQTIQIS